MQKISARKYHMGLLLIRIAIGTVFVVHGYVKLQNLESAVLLFEQLGLSAIWAYIVAGIEFFAGSALILGIFVEYTASIIVILMIFSMYLISYSKGFLGGYEFDFVLLLSSVGLILTGPGRYAIVIGKKRKSKYEDGVLPGYLKLDDPPSEE